MSKLPAITFSKTTGALKGALIFFVCEKGKLPPSAANYDKDKRITQALKAADFSGAHGSLVEVVAPTKSLDRIVVAGLGKLSDFDEDAMMKIGGKLFVSRKKSTQITIMGDLSGRDKELSAVDMSAIAAGIKLRAYKFDRHKTKTKKKVEPSKFNFVTNNEARARKAWKGMDGISDGVVFARDLVNEPANILGPVEFAKKAAGLKKLGCQVEILDEKKLKNLKMGALLGVAQGSPRPARVAVIKWNGGKAKTQPVAFIGKGVVFDTGGISIKPAGGMEDMKGDMGGAAAVCGVMHALSARKAKVNAVGIIGLVENMPDGNAQRPGDVVKSMSGQTIEVINTDAEGRLVLADLLWYCEGKYKPKFMINLATLTGAILVALGNHHAGIFSNDDQLSEQLSKAGLDTQELVWRLPLAAAYDKLIDTPNADMKNIGGRMAGSITAAQFLQRFVRDTPWAHIDIAGTAMGSPKTEYNQSWGSGYGVRLLDRLIANNYE